MRKFDPSFVIPQLVLGADMSLDFLAISGAGFIRRGLAEDMAALADSRLRLRCILLDSGSSYIAESHEPRSIQADEQIQIATQLEEWGWSVRLTAVPPSRNCIIVDEQVAILSPDGSSLNSDMPEYVTENPATVASLQEHFNSVWHAGSAEEQQPIQPLYECLLQTANPEEASGLISVSQNYWDPIIQKLVGNPELMHTMNDRVFEEFVGELLTREGMEVQLTQRTRDGGYDMLACADTAVGVHLYLVECKRYAPYQPVDVGIVRQINGVLESQRATAAMVVTTSRFTRPAQDFAQTVQHRLHLRDFRELQDWIVRNAYK